jgi:uncharacterized membrane protein
MKEKRIESFTETWKRVRQQRKYVDLDDAIEYDSRIAKRMLRSLIGSFGILFGVITGITLAFVSADFVFIINNMTDLIVALFVITALCIIIPIITTESYKKRLERSESDGF